jgi:predicted nucleotidyltransferase
LVRGTPTPQSDVDLIAVMREAEPRRMDRIPRLLELFAGSPLPVDVHPCTVAEWEAAGDDPLRPGRAGGRRPAAVTRR